MEKKLLPVIFVFRLETMQSDRLATMSTFRHSRHESEEPGFQALSIVGPVQFTRVAGHQKDGISKEELP